MNVSQWCKEPYRMAEPNFDPQPRPSDDDIEGTSTGVRCPQCGALLLFAFQGGAQVRKCPSCRYTETA